MPSKTKKQAHYMSAVAHGWHPEGVKVPPLKVAQEFHNADKKVGKYMHKAGGGRVKALGELAQKLADKMPKPGFRSTLEDLIHTAPMEQAPAGEWRNYLKPGKMLNREGIEFPLKADELKYSTVNDLLQYAPDRNIRRDEILGQLQRNYPKFENMEQKANARGPDIEVPPEHGSSEVLNVNGAEFPDQLPRYSEYAHTNRDPNKPGTPYVESRTNSPDFGKFPTHFEDGTISHSRATDHDTEEGHGVKLIEEIQSDRHQAANDMLSNFGPANLDENGQRPIVEEKRGYRSPEDEQIISGLHKEWDTHSQADRDVKLPTLQKASSRVPDAPFKDPKEYAAVEIKKHLLDAVNSDQKYLALTTGQDQVERYAQGMEEEGNAQGMRHVYDKVYPSVMKSLANQYGGKMSVAKIPVETIKDNRPMEFIANEVENIDDYLDVNTDREGDTDYSGIPLLLKQYQEILRGNKGRAISKEFVNASNYLKKINREKDEDTRMGLEEMLHGSLQTLDHYRTKAAELETKIKEFPAIEITPEMRDAIKKAGVSLFSAAPAIIAGCAALNPSGDQNPAPEQFAEGGPVFVRGQPAPRLPPPPSARMLNQNPLQALAQRYSTPGRALQMMRQEPRRSFTESSPSRAGVQAGLPGAAPRIRPPASRPGAPPSIQNGGRPYVPPI